MVMTKIEIRKKLSLYCDTFSFLPTLVFATSLLLGFYTLYWLQKQIFSIIIFLSSLLLITCIVITVKVFNRKKRTSKKLFIFLITILLGFVFSSVAYIHFLYYNIPILSLAKTKNIIKITASLDKDATPKGSKYYVTTAKVTKCECKDGSVYTCKGIITLFIPKTLVQQNYMGGSTIQKNVELSLFCKGSVIEAEGYFSEKERNVPILHSNAKFFVKKNSTIKFMQFTSPVYSYRIHARFYINRLLYGWEKAGYLLQALLTANRDFVPKEDLSAFRNAGLSHILALSGMHLAIISGLSAFFASMFFNRKYLKLIILLVSGLFLFFAGASPSLNRAFMMLSTIAVARLISVKANLLGVLAFTFSVHIILIPQDAVTLSFILSYGALFGILVFSSSIHYFFSIFTPDAINISISASLGATLFTFPIIAFSIGQISLIGIVSTCIISPLISIFIILGIVSIAISMAIPSLYSFFGMILNVLYEIIISSTRFFSAFPILRFEGNTIRLFLAFLPVFLGFSIVLTQKLSSKKRTGHLNLR